MQRFAMLVVKVSKNNVSLAILFIIQNWELISYSYYLGKLYRRIILIQDFHVHEKTLVIFI